MEFQKIGSASVALMAVVGAACGFAAAGLARNAEWGRRLAIGVLTVNLVTLDARPSAHGKDVVFVIPA